MDELLRVAPIISIVLTLVLGAVSGVLAWSVWSLRQAFVSKSDLSTSLMPVLAELREQQNRLTQVEADMRHVPTHDDLTSIRGDLTSVRIAVGGLEKAVEGLREVITRIARPLDTLVNSYVEGGVRR